MFAVCLHYTAFLFAFLCVPGFGRWMRRKSVGIGRKAHLRMQRCQPALLQRAQQDYEYKIWAISVLIFCCQFSCNIYRYGFFCGGILLLLHHVKPSWTPDSASPERHLCHLKSAGCVNQGSRGSLHECSDGAHVNRRHYRGGATSDAGHFSNDATLDLAMYVTVTKHFFTFLIWVSGSC